MKRYVLYGALALGVSACATPEVVQQERLTEIHLKKGCPGT